MKSGSTEEAKFVENELSGAVGRVFVATRRSWLGLQPKTKW